jgi:Tol biopolymer transport system component
MPDRMPTTSVDKGRGTRPTIALQVGVVAGILALVTLLGPPAQQASAAFPGKNGRIFFNSNQHGNAEIYSINPDGSGETRLTNNPASDTEPAVSPNGDRIAFSSDRDDGDGLRDRDIYVMNAADGREVDQITSGPADEEHPAFTPDGEGIVYVSDAGFGDFDIYLRAGAGDFRLLTQEIFDPMDPHQPDDEHPAPTPTANRIAFESNRAGNENVHIQPLYPSDGFRITNDPADDEAPNWSPDGERIVFTSDRSNDAGLTNESVFVMSAFGQNEHRLTNRDEPVTQDLDPAFSPDGARIVFWSNREGGTEIYSMNAKGSDVTAVTDTPGLDRNPDWGRPPCTISGSNGDDVLNGTPTADVICGLGGDDRLRGLEGSDEVRGGGGNDIVYGGSGKDRVLGELGDDIGNTEDTVQGNDIADGGGGSRDSCRTDPGDVTVNCP